ncbi:MAG: HAMP domain-containing sensor histidine kinase [Pseudomonadota bacterium]
MKSLYLRIYLTVVAVLLLFALVAGGIAHWRLQQAQREGQQRVQAVWAERAQAWAELLERNLPPATAPEQEQADAVLDWSRRLRQPMALDDAQGRRVATSPRLQELLDEHDPGEPPPGLLRHELSDGRVLWVARRPQRDVRLSGAPPSWMAEQREGGRGGRVAPMPPPPPWWAVLLPWPGGGVPGVSGGMALMLVALFTAVAAGAWPVVRRLTARLERLKRGVERFGAGELDHRVAVDGRDEVATVARSFNEAAQRIEDLVRAHRSLLANASHELRSPLARLKMALALMEDASPERRRALRREIEHDIGELDQLVEEVLLSSRLDARAGVERQPVDALAVAAEEAMRTDARLDIVEPPAGAAQPAPGWHLSGDERLLRRALRNLLENARRHGQPVAAGHGDEEGPDDTAVHLEVAQRRRADGRGELVFRVLDRGPGVPEAERERIFEPFYRRAGHGEGAGGVGLGLALVRQIAHGHGGSVHCEARPGGGSAFVLTVPVEPAAPPPRA